MQVLVWQDANLNWLYCISWMANVLIRRWLMSIGIMGINNIYSSHHLYHHFFSFISRILRYATYCNVVLIMILLNSVKSLAEHRSSCSKIAAEVFNKCNGANVFTIRWDIKTIDRISMIEDVLKVFSFYNVNIISMKVITRRILIKSICYNVEDVKKIIKRLNNLHDIIDVGHFSIGRTIISTLTKQNDYFNEIIGESQHMRLLIEKAMKFAQSNFTLLIRGETGTGKELLARAIHNCGPRRLHAFIPVNCSAIPEELIESEFFGYEKGAFTGADGKGKKGLFEMADKGTLFLDEFGEMPLSMQAKMLRVLQDSCIRSIGSSQIVSLNTRVIVATNANLEEMILNRQLRADLYYRINILSLTIPPLRQHPQDITLLIDHFLKKHVCEFNRALVFDKQSLEILQNYAWPGNIRELENVIIRLMHMSERGIVTKEELEWMNYSCEDSLQGHNGNNSPLKEQVRLTERKIIEKMLDYNVSARGIAKVLGVSHTTVLNKIRSYQEDAVS
ncbi:sigma 54-interacting transcriptional regulator [Escherichia sp. E4385]|uniref:sigma-54 interaction domain-containing protein n=1 Tax=Escherichia sp. E4385 TaxID=2040639 RepID=UPI001F10284D|nr:sigma 54-interacting transcriptional regulator [Escherichia sp. E4385]